MKKLHLWVIIAMVLAVGMLFGTIISETKTFSKLFENENTEEVQESQDDVTIVNESETIYSFLQMREEMKEQRWIDSTFMAMPEIVLIDILKQHGTSISIRDIVYIYDSNRDIYNKVEDGANAKKLLDSLQNSNIKNKDTTALNIVELSAFGD